MVLNYLALLYQISYNFFNRFGRLPFERELGAWGGFQPRIDVHETDTEIKVSAEVPGLSENDVELTLTDDALLISGEKRAEKEDKGHNYYRRECAVGAFQRAVPLPGPVDAGRVEAVFKNGVVTVTLPKPPELQKRRTTIPVKTA